MSKERTGNGENARMEQLLADIRVVVRDGQELLRAGVGSLKEKAREGAQSTDRFVKDNPYYGVGMAFGLGLLSGLLTAGLLMGSKTEDE